MNLNPVITTITVAGKPCYFVHISLHQTFNNHHSFEIKLDYDQLDILWMNNPVQIIQLMGKDVNITMFHKVTGETNLFNGIIADVSMNGMHGEQNYITVSGYSPTIRLDGTPTMDSFMDLDLKTIVDEAVATSGNGAEVDTKPLFKGTIDYICQYDETAHNFLNRLSWLYGEWYFYDGTTIHFGKPDLGPPAILVYDEDITKFDLRAKLVPPKVKRYEYLTHDVNEINSDTPESVDGVRGYIKVALDKSHEVYTSDAVRPLESSISSKKDLDDLVKVDKYRMVSQMLTMHAKTETCKVKIGKLVNINLPKNMRVPLKHVETFLVTDLLHEIDQDGTYINTFSAIPSEMENIPMQAIPAPKALPQVAWVKSNADPDGKGRVTVEFQWQKQAKKTTNWIRVQTPDGGSSKKVAKNRGFVFIPEEEDQVMINFENGDPNRPYVSASIFKENVGRGGKIENHLKSIITRSGIKIVFNDIKGSLHIEDPSGNTWDMDGNENIKVYAPSNITIEAGKNMSVIVGENLNVEVGNSITTNAGDTISVSATDLNETTSSSISIATKSMSTNVDDRYSLNANTILEVGGQVDIYSQNENMTLFSGKNVETKSANKKIRLS